MTFSLVNDNEFNFQNKLLVEYTTVFSIFQHVCRLFQILLLRSVFELKIKKDKTAVRPGNDPFGLWNTTQDRKIFITQSKLWYFDKIKSS